MLWFLKSKACTHEICSIFGIVPFSAYVRLDFGMEVLYKVVINPRNMDFEIRLSTTNEMYESSLLLEQNRQYGTLLRGVFAVTDGARMPCTMYECLLGGIHTGRGSH